jgi:hypothetical protein
MDTLPESLPLLDERFEKKVAEFKRLHPIDGVGGKLAEKDYDALVVEHHEIIAETLRAAGLLAPDSDLRLLGRQIHSIDVLFAEVNRDDGEFLQFVVFEDKLVRNPEARREVLGQVVDYALKLRNLCAKDIVEALPLGETRDWLAGEENVKRALQDGDFLLVICGDRVHRKVVDYLGFLKEQLDPLTSVEIALMSLAIYSNGSQHILVPHVVSALRVEERKTIRVVVEGPRGAAMAAEVKMEVESEDVKGGPRRESMELEDILQAIGTKAGDDAVGVAQKLFKQALDLGMRLEEPGASISARFRRPGTKRDCTLFAVTQVGTFYIGWLSHWAKAGAPASVAEEYQKTLVQLFGNKVLVENCGTGGNSAPTLVSVAKHLSQVEAAIAHAIAGLAS